MAATAEAKVEPLVSKLDPARFFGAEYKRNVHLLNLSADVPYEDLFKPEAWKLIAQKGSVGIGDKIEVRRDDMSLYAELWVVESIMNHARIRSLSLSRKSLRRSLRTTATIASSRSSISACRTAGRF